MVKAKKVRHTASKPAPQPPNAMLNACCVTAAPFKPSVLASVSKMINAVAVHTKMVSINTPTNAAMPCSAGCATLAVACACGVEPMPASLENKPRATP